MASTGLLKVMDVNGLSYLYTKLRNNIDEFQNNSKSVIDAAAAAANSAAERANAIVSAANDTYATKEELNNAISGITSFEFSVVNSLPETGVKGTIYLVANDSGNQSTDENVYDEYIWLGTKYEKIGTTSVNLAEYLKSDDASSTYLSKTAAASTYALNTTVEQLTTIMGEKLNSTDAASTYATKSDLSTLSTTVDGKIDSSVAATLYATKSDVSAKLDSELASNTYATKEELSTASGNMTNSLADYVTNTALQSALSAITSFEFSVVDSLPQTGVKGTIYLVANSSGNQAGGNNVHDEYIWIETGYEKIGSTSIDLSEYIKSADAASTYLSKTDAASTYLSKTDASSLYLGKTATAAAASKLATARTITIAGAVSGSASFDGSAAITINTRVASGTSAPTSLADGQLYVVYDA